MKKEKKGIRRKNKKKSKRKKQVRAKKKIRRSKSSNSKSGIRRIASKANTEKKLSVYEKIREEISNVKKTNKESSKTKESRVQDNKEFDEYARKLKSEINAEILKKKQDELIKRKIRRRQLIKFYTQKAGLEIEDEVLRRRIFTITVITTLLISLLSLIKFAQFNTPLNKVISFMIVLWILIFPLLLIVFWLLFFAYIDILIYRRKIQVENVLADFLQLTAANVRAGMTIDKALWYSIRPRFGVLARELEIVAKQTMMGKSLEKSLLELADKYDSLILKNSISLLIEGLAAGGEVGSLLNRIAENIQETQLLKKEMAANVMTYVIFITFASILAAPFLMALSYQLLIVINTLGESVASQQVPNVGVGISFSKPAITPKDFKIFAILSLTVTSMFSAMIITTIRKGNIKEGVKTIPIFIAISLALFFTFTSILTAFFSGLF